MKVDSQIAVFTQEDEDLINALSSQVAIAVENATVLHRTLGSKKSLEQALDASHDIVLSVDPEFEIVFQSTSEISPNVDFSKALSTFPALKECVDMSMAEASRV